MHPILTGSLRRFAAVDVVHFIVESRMSGLLTIDAGGGYRIRFEKGRITGAALESAGPDSTVGELVVRAMIQENGHFALYDSRGFEESRVNLDSEPLIQQARERIEASEEFDLGWVFMLARDLESDEMFSAKEVRILCEADGRTPASDLIERCSLDPTAAKRVIGSLIRRGWLISREGSKAVELPAAMPPADKQEQASADDPDKTNPGIDPADVPQSHSGTERGRIACFTLDDTNSTSYPLFDEIQTIGRGPQNAIRIDDRSVSSSHAKITLTPEGHLIEDLGSSNGTYVNGKQIERVVLRDKDRIRLGKMFMVYMIPEVSRDSEEAERSP